MFSCSYLLSQFSTGDGIDFLPVSKAGSGMLFHILMILSCRDGCLKNFDTFVVQKAKRQMRRHFSKSYLGRPMRIKTPSKKISCSHFIAERRAGRMLIKSFPGNCSYQVRMQLSDKVVPTADSSPRYDLLLQMTSTVFTTIALPLMFISVDLGVSMLFS